MGLRSLVNAEKRLRERHGTVVLAAVAKPVRQVLEMARLHTILRLAGSVDAALPRSSGSVAPERALRSQREGRACAVWPLGGRACSKPGVRLRTPWPRRSRQTGWRHSRSRISAYAVGSGGFGATREQASEATGPLMAVRAFAGLRTPGTHDPSDFLVPERPADALVHVASALGIDGSPGAALHIGSDAPFAVTDLVGDVLALSGDSAGPDPRDGDPGRREPGGPAGEILRS